MTDPHWYVVDKRGMATCCADETDALEVARTSNLAYPQWGPHRAVRLIAVADYDRMRDALAEIADYWNRDQNEPAMQDACWHAINTANAALAQEGS